MWGEKKNPKITCMSGTLLDFPHTNMVCVFIFFFLMKLD